MLPKIRPAAGYARPAIRPVKASPPPPPPSPPRRFPSGVASKGRSANPDARVIAIDVDADDDLRATAVAPYTEAPPEAPTKPMEHAKPSPRRSTDAIAFDDETQARPVDDYLLKSMRAPERDGEAPRGELAVPFESLPSLEARRPFDTYEAEFAERDPVTQMVAAHESNRVRRGQRERAEVPGLPTTREGSGPRERPAESRGAHAGAHERFDDHESYASYASPPPPYDEIHESYGSFQSGPQTRGWSDGTEHLPPAPAVPHDMRFRTPPPFIQGVQPIRPANNYTPANASVMTPPPAAPMYPTQPPPMYAERAQAHAPYPMQPMQAMPMQRMPMQPVGPTMAPPSPAARKSGIGRIAWFVFGAAFGIAFAFVATGYAPRFGQPDTITFPPPPPRAAAATQTLPPSAVTAPPTATPPAAGGPTTATANAPTPEAAPQGAAGANTSTSTNANAMAPAPSSTLAATNAKPPPPRRAPPPPRRPSAPPPDREASAAPKKIGTSVEAPDSPGTNDGPIGNILGDALKP